MIAVPASLTVIARRFSFVRETDGPNRGAWVSWFQRLCRGVPGDSWCADFVSVVLDVAYHGAPPLRATGSCQAMLDEAAAKGLVVDTPALNDLYFVLTDEGRAHHCGIVTATAPLIGIAGNTSPGGSSSNGTGVFEHTLQVKPLLIRFVRLKGEAL